MAEGLLLRGCDVMIPGCTQSGADILIRNGEIVRIDQGIDPSEAERSVQVGGRLVTLGLVDMHVHFREPGFEYKETVATGSAAAAAGGFTTVCSMPNLRPVQDSMDSLRLQLDAIERDARVRVIPYGAITVSRAGRELADHAAMAPYVAGFSDDGSGVQDEQVMERAMRSVATTGKVLAAHCEVTGLLGGRNVHDGRWAAAHGLRGISSESEWREIERDIALSERTGCPLHICHVSTREGVELVRRAKSRGVRVTCETAPHYLVLCEDDLQDEGRFKMNPPLRSALDRDALVEGLRDGTVDLIATDHAPHSAQEKSGGLAQSAMGIVGLETSLAVTYSRLVETGKISLERMLDAMSWRARSIFGLQSVGNGHLIADLTVIDRQQEWSVDSSEFLSKGHSTPCDGWRLRSRAVMTLVGGEIVYDRLSAMED